jgi:predicted ATPase
LTIYEIGQFNDWHFIVTEFIKGDTLRQRQKSGRMTLHKILDITAQIAAALSAMHEAGIIHRDIKPENIMLRNDDLVKVLDFGISKFIEEKKETTGKRAVLSEQVQTMPGTVMGTAAYMSPEQARGLPVDEQTDIWSLGVILYEMIAGKQPFTGETNSDTIASILITDPASLDEHTPAELDRIIKKSLQKKVSERYQTIKDFLFDLNHLRKRIEFEIEQNFFEVRTAGGNHDSKATNMAINSIPSKATLPPNNLTETPLPLIGREKEITEIKHLLRNSGVRLLTLTGVGGTGKTRLARTVAQEMLPEFPDGVFFVELAPINDYKLVAATVAAPLGLKEAGGKPIFEVLKDYLQSREMLIVTDNFEQVVEAAPQIAELLAGNDHLKILITSRMTLNLSAEREFVVAPLAVPSKAALDSIDEFSKYESTELFVDRARTVKPDFALTQENIRIVGEICLRLDGLPLAIELAAARVKIFSPQIILTKLENSLNFLTGGAMDLPAHQQTMRDTLSWSYELLSKDEKHLFRRLAVFAGGFTLEAAENVSCNNRSFDKNEEGFENKKTLTASDTLFTVLDGIISLVDKSLLVSKQQTNGSVRFRMLEVVREYALESLKASGEEKKLRRNHAAYFLALGEEAEPHLQAVQSVQWLDIIEEEYDNLRAALHWSLENDVETVVRLAAAIRNFWILHNYLTEGRGWLKAALVQSNGVHATIRFKILNMLALLARLQGDFKTSREIYEAGLAAGKAANDLKQIAMASRGVGSVAHLQGDFTSARKFYEEGLAISRKSEDESGTAVSLSFLGDLAFTEGDNATARPFLEEALKICRKIGNKQTIICIFSSLGAIAYNECDYDAALSIFAEGLAIARELGIKSIISYFLDGFAALALKSADVQVSAYLAGAAHHLRESIGYEIEPAERCFRDAYLTELRTTLSEVDFAAAYEKGSKMELEEAIAIALA